MRIRGHTYAKNRCSDSGQCRGDNGKRVNSTHGLDDGQVDSVAYVFRERLVSHAAGAGQDVVLGAGEVGGQIRRDVTDAQVLVDDAGRRHEEDDAEALRDTHDADGAHAAERAYQEAAAADPEQGAVAVDGRVAGIRVDGDHERGADHSQKAAAQEPGHDVAELGHHEAVEDGHGDNHEDKRQQTNGGLNGSLPPS